MNCVCAFAAIIVCATYNHNAHFTSNYASSLQSVFLKLVEVCC